MLKILLTGALLMIAPAAFAAGPDEPVQKVMALAEALWSDKGTEGQDYFDATHLPLFSKDFVAAYKEAAKYPIYDEAGGPFGYDVITNGQDGCPLKDIVILAGAETAGKTDVKVTFKLWACSEDASTDKNQLSEVHFDVITEEGKPVIADIHRLVEGKADSLLQEMKDIAKNGAAPATEPAETAQ